MASLGGNENRPLIKQVPPRRQQIGLKKTYVCFIGLSVFIFFLYLQLNVSKSVNVFTHTVEVDGEIKKKGDGNNRRYTLGLHSKYVALEENSNELVRETTDDKSIEEKSSGVNRIVTTDGKISPILEPFPDVSQRNNSLDVTKPKENKTTRTHGSSRTSTSGDSSHNTTKDSDTSSGYKTVLFYTEFFGGSWSDFLRDRRTDLAYYKCPVYQCHFILDRSKAPIADAVVFHATGYNSSDLPKVRHPHQRYIWMNVEAPGLDLRSSNEKYHGKPGFFNWTATYNRKSEIVIPYGGMVPKEGETIPSRLFPIDRNSVSYRKYMKDLSKRTHPNNMTASRRKVEEEEESDNVDELPANGIKYNSDISTNRSLGLYDNFDLANSTLLKYESLAWRNHSFYSRPKTAVWMVSNCNTVSGREIYINELRKYLHVDIYGSCGTLKCGKNHFDTYCYSDILRRKYKFYLAFENSWCRDYITEKVFLPLKHGLVPVVFGGSAFDDFLPPHSYIDATKLTPKNLARELIRIASSEEEYATYHLWRDYFIAVVPAPFCDLCQRLHSDVIEAQVPDLGRWWSEVNNCSTRYPESKYPRKGSHKFVDFIKSSAKGLQNIGSALKYFMRD